MINRYSDYLGWVNYCIWDLNLTLSFLENKVGAIWWILQPFWIEKRSIQVVSVEENPSWTKILVEEMCKFVCYRNICRYGYTFVFIYVYRHICTDMKT